MFLMTDNQKKVFSKWIRSIIPEFQESQFYEQIRDSRFLVQLLDSLSNSKIIISVECRSNKEIIADIFRTLEEHFFIELGCLTADSFITADQSQYLNFLWLLILHFVALPCTKQLKEFSLFDNCELALLQWCRNSTFGYKDVDITNFSTSWKSGLAFNAIIHKHNPTWFSYTALVGKSPHSNVEHAFYLAQTRLGVAKLLEWEDLDTDHPDSRSVILYIITCLKELLKLLPSPSSSSFNLPFENIKKHDMVSPQCPHMTTSDDQQDIFSADFSNFFSTSEETLAWFEKIMSEISSSPEMMLEDLEDLREQFQRHEKLMSRLTSKQDDIGQVLSGGSHLTRSNLLDEHKRKQIDQRIELMDNKWEELRSTAMERQNRLQSALMEGQQHELNNFSKLLSSFEGQLNEFSSASFESVERRADWLRDLKERMKSIQKEVTSLQSMLLVVDENNSHLAIEEQLEDLGKRWLTARSTLSDQELLTIQLEDCWKDFNLKLTDFKEWLAETETLLNRVTRLERRRSSSGSCGTGGHGGHASKRRNSSSLDDVVRQVRCLKMIENDMDDMMEQFTHLNQVGCELANASRENESVISFINVQLQSCQERWDEIVKKMESLSDSLARSGVEISVVSSEGSEQEVVMREAEEKEEGGGNVGGFEAPFSSIFPRINKQSCQEKIKPFESLLHESPTNIPEVNVLKNFQGFSKPVKTNSDDETTKRSRTRNLPGRVKARKMSEDGGHRSSSLLRGQTAGRGSRKLEGLSGEDIIQLISISKRGHGLATFSLLKKKNPPQAVETSFSGASWEVVDRDFEKTEEKMKEGSMDSVGLTQLKLDFDRQVAALNQWLDQQEVTQEMVSVEGSDLLHQSNNGLTIEEQAVLIDDAEKDQMSQLKNLKRLKQTEKQLYQELNLSNKAVDSTTVEIVSSIEERWNNLSSLLKKNKEYLLSVQVSSKFLEELQNLERNISVYEKWVDARLVSRLSGDFSHLSRLLEQNRVKMKALQLHEESINRLTSQSGRFKSDPQLVKSLNVVTKKFKDTMEKMNSRQDALAQALQSIPSKSFSDSLAATSRWLDQVETRMSMSPLIVIDSVENIRHNIKSHESILAELQNKSSTLEYLNHAAEEMMSKISKSESTESRMSKDINDLNLKWVSLQNVLHSKIDKLNVAVEKVSDFQIHCKELNKWLDEMENFLNTDSLPRGNLDLLKAQLNESEGVMEDIRTMEPSMSSMNEVVDNFCSNAEEMFAKKLRADQKLMNARWTNIYQLSKKQQESQISDLAKLESIFDRLACVERWTESTLKSCHLKDCEIRSIQELEAFLQFFKNLEAESEEHRQQTLFEIGRVLDSMKQEGNIDDTEQDDCNVFHAFRNLSGKFESVASRLGDFSEKFSNVKKDLNLLTELLKEEEVYSTKLKSQLKRHSQSKTMDAEELSEELEELEIVLSSKTDENFSRITKLCHGLMNNHVLIDDINSRLEFYLKEHKHLHDQANLAALELSDMIHQGQEMENMITDVSQWLSEVDETLREKLVLGLFADKVTVEEFKSMRHDFEERRSTLRKLTYDVEAMKKKGKVEAASKLDEQLQLLLKHYREVEETFLKWQRPSGFDDKLARLKRELDELNIQLNGNHGDGSCGAGKLKSLNENEICREIELKMDVYETMSHMKNDVENVIRTGRQVVDKKQTPQPDQLTSQLDDLKKLYNGLGLQVTTDKNQLEELLKVLEDNEQNLAYVDDFVDSFMKSLHTNESTLQSGNLDNFHTWVEVVNIELSKHLKSTELLKSSFHEYKHLVDEEAIGNFQSKVNKSIASLEKLSKRLAEFTDNLEKEDELVHSTYENMKSIQSGLIRKLDEAEEEFSTTGQLKCFMTSVKDLLSQLEMFRGLAREMNLRRSKFSSSIEILCREVNQKWKKMSILIADEKKPETGDGEKINNETSSLKIMVAGEAIHDQTHSSQVSQSIPTTEESHEMCIEMFALPEVHSICEELEDINMWINNLEAVIQAAKSPSQASATTSFLKDDFTCRASKLNNLQLGLGSQRISNKLVEEKLKEYFTLLKLRMVLLERELFGDEGKGNVGGWSGDPRDTVTSAAVFWDADDISQLQFGSNREDFFKNLKKLEEFISSLEMKLTRCMERTSDGDDGDSNLLLSELPLKSLYEDIKLAETTLKMAECSVGETFEGSGRSDSDVLQRTVTDLFDRVNVLKNKKEETQHLQDGSDGMRRWLEEAEACLDAEVDVFMKENIFVEITRSRDIVNKFGELRRKWIKLSREILLSSPGDVAVEDIQIVNSHVFYVNKTFVKMLRRKLKLEKLLPDTERNVAYSNNISDVVCEARRYLREVREVSFHTETEDIEILLRILTRGQESYDGLSKFLMSVSRESDVIKVSSDENKVDTSRHMSEWVTLKNQVNALQGLNRVLMGDSMDELEEKPVLTTEPEIPQAAKPTTMLPSTITTPTTMLPSTTTTATTTTTILPSITTTTMTTTKLPTTTTTTRSIRRNVSVDEISINETSFADFIAHLSSQRIHEFPQLKDSLRVFCLSIEELIEATSRSKVVVCDSSNIKAVVSSIHEKMKNVENRSADLRSQLSLAKESGMMSNTDADSVQYLGDEKIDYCSSECSLLVMRRNLDLEDLQMESNQMSAMLDDLKHKIDDFRLKSTFVIPSPTCRGDDDYDDKVNMLWSKATSSLNKMEKTICDKLQSCKLKADALMRNFPAEDFSLLNQLFQCVEQEWMGIQAINCSQFMNVVEEPKTMMLMEKRKSGQHDLKLRIESASKDSEEKVNELEKAVLEVNQLNKWLEELNVDFDKKKKISCKDLKSLKSQVKELEVVNQKLEANQAEITKCLLNVDCLMSECSDSSPRKQKHLSDLSRKFRQNYDVFKQLLDTEREEKSKIVENVKRHEEKNNRTEKMLKRLSSIVTLWRPLVNQTRNQLDSELASVNAVKSELSSMRNEIDGIIMTDVNGGRNEGDLQNTILPIINISQLNENLSRISSLEKITDTRLKLISEKLDEFCSHSEARLSKTVSHPWERSVTEDSLIPYYINHSLEKTQWDHPEMSALLKELENLNDIKFSAYRTAMKMRMLQKRLSLENLQIVDVETLFQEISPDNPNNSNDTCQNTSLSANDCIRLIAKLFELQQIRQQKQSSTTEKQQQQDRCNLQKEMDDISHVSLSIELIVNCLLNIYDCSRTGAIGASSFKIFLIIFSSGSLNSKYKALFSTISTDDHTTAKQLKSLINDCLSIPKHLCEFLSFNEEAVDLTVSSCFEKANNLIELNQSNFVEWMRLEPQSLVWIGVHDRLCTAETAVHPMKCNVCRQHPILGFRYRCLKCFNFDMCQTCFFHGLCDKGHKLSHPMQEYCNTRSSADNMKDFTKMFRNKFRSKRYFKTHHKLGYLPVSGAQSMTTGNTRDNTPSNTLERSRQVKQDDERLIKGMRSEFVTSVATATIESSKHSQVQPMTRSRSVDDVTRASSESGDEIQEERRKRKKKKNDNNKPAMIDKPEDSIVKEAQLLLGVYASRLAQVEDIIPPHSLDWSDEHNLIGQYCRCLKDRSCTLNYLQSPMQIVMSVEEDYKRELEAAIKELEEENKLLQKEYNQLKKAQQRNQHQIERTSKSELATREDSSAVNLQRNRKEKLETRMKSIEQRSERHDVQLKKLKKMLAEQFGTSMTKIISYNSCHPSDKPVPLPTSFSPICPPSFELVSKRSHHKVEPIDTISDTAQEQQAAKTKADDPKRSSGDSKHTKVLRKHRGKT